MAIKERMTGITISDSARDYIASVSNGKLLNIVIKSGGCAGFSYSMDLIEEKDVADTDLIIQDNSTEIVIDENEFMLLIGTEMDYVSNLGGSHFSFNNPNATSSCGCNNSFSV